MLLTIMFVLTGLTILIDITMLTILTLMNINQLKDIKRYLTNAQDEKDIKQAMEEIEVL